MIPPYVEWVDQSGKRHSFEPDDYLHTSTLYDGVSGRFRWPGSFSELPKPFDKLLIGGVVHVVSQVDFQPSGTTVRFVDEARFLLTVSAYQAKVEVPKFSTMEEADAWLEERAHR